MKTNGEKDAGGKPKGRALISVYEKDGILDLAALLAEKGWELLSTGGTAKYLRESNIPVTDVSSITGFPECLDGRVKTLHPAIHAGLLARRDLDSHTETLRQLNLDTIDLVCVNLYPFFEKVNAANLSLEETIEFIDIGGPAILRSAAKNFRYVIALTDPADYDEAIRRLKEDSVSVEYKRYLAGKVFSLTSAYDAAIARYLLELDSTPKSASEDTGRSNAADYPAFWPLSLRKAQSLRYGENGHQSAALYFHSGRPGAVAGMEQLHGKELGYNNIRDLDLAWKAACAFGLAGETPPVGEAEAMRLVPGYAGLAGKACCVAVKHNTPCGIALGNSLPEAYEKTFACDPVSIYGGIVACNAVLDVTTAARLAELFLEIVVAPGFEEDALRILQKKKNLRIIRAFSAPSDTKECIAVDGGILVQDTDRKLLVKWEVVTKEAPSPMDIPDLVFGMMAVTFVKSNGILIAKDLAATGIGGGQVNRIWPARQALERSAAVIEASAGKFWNSTPNQTDTMGQIAGTSLSDHKPARVLASDAFIPFADLIEAASSSGIKSIIQPGGSIHDKDSIEACDRLGLAMVFTGIRHFKH